MSRPINRDVFITAAVTGSGDTCDKHPGVPKSPKEIADSAIACAKAGAAIIHMHVRHPKTGIPSRELALYREVFRLCREAEEKEGVDIIINFTAGMGGDLEFDNKEDGYANPEINAKNTDLCGPYKRLEHIIELKPEICTLDCGSFNWGHTGSYIVMNTPDVLRKMAAKIKECGVKPECEVFDTGNLGFVNQIHKEGLLQSPPMVQLCMGIPGSAPADVKLTQAMADMLPSDCVFSGFAISRNEMPFAALMPLIGGNVRVGLEDNLYKSRGQLASNEELVTKAKNIIEEMGCKVMGPKEVREKLGLVKNAYKGIPEGLKSYAEVFPEHAKMEAGVCGA